MMKLAFVSNYLSIHQVSLCEELYKHLGSGFHYISVEKISDWRIASGYRDLDFDYKFVIRAYEDETKALKIVEEADVVIIGSAPDKYIVKRLLENKITFRYSERLYKKELTVKSYPRALVSSWLHHKRFRNKPLYMLCASAYTANDCLRFGNYRGKLFKWGYFPELKNYDIGDLFRLKNNVPVQLLWVGRLIEFKHPLMAIEVAQYLRNKGIAFHLTIVGTGKQESDILQLIKLRKLEEYIHLVGAVPAAEVRGYMETANVFLFTSDREEGWGAVVNEAMNSGCAVVACKAAGSVPFLITDKVNGLLFNVGDQEMLNKCVKRLIEDRNFCQTLGRNAYTTIQKVWNARVAAERLLILIDSLKKGGTPFKEGLCSPAEIVN